MGIGTTIQWTDASWNPLRATQNDNVGHYCEMVSPGCAHCYSSTMQKRFKMPAFVAGQNRGNVETYLDEKVLTQPLRWRKPKMVFVCSMTDLFGEWVSDATIEKVFAVMACCPAHTFQVLTKRADRMATWFNRPGGVMCTFPGSIPIGKDDLMTRGMDMRWPLPNVWLGVSVEDQKRADERIPHLLRTPAVVRFISAEPLLGSLNLHGRVGPKVFSGLDWVIVGGESGAGARPCDIEWIRAIRDQCAAASVPVFIKQLGARIEIPNDSFSEWPNDGYGLLYRVEYEPGYQGAPVVVSTTDSKGGDMDEWPTDLRIRNFPNPQGT